MPIMSGEDRASRLRGAIERQFAPVELLVEDDSARHAGHSGSTGGGETHFNVTLVSAHFRGMSRVARARAVHDALGPEFASGLHALALTLRTPEEER